MPPLSPSQRNTLKKGLHKLLGTLEFREVQDQFRRCVLASQKLNLPLASVAKAMGLEPQQALRAKKAIQEGRDIGVNGRPRALRNQSEGALIQEVTNSVRRGEMPSFREFKEKVRLSFDTNQFVTNPI